MAFRTDQGPEHAASIPFYFQYSVAFLLLSERFCCSVSWQGLLLFKKYQQKGEYCQDAYHEPGQYCVYLANVKTGPGLDLGCTPLVIEANPGHAGRLKNDETTANASAK